MGSDRSFGLVFAAFFALIGLYPLVHAQAPRTWSLAVGAAFLAAAILVPRALNLPNKLWFKFGLMVGKVMTPVVMTLIYALTVVPIGILLRFMGKDLLRLERQPAAKSYWIERSGDIGSMKRQF